MHLLSDFCSKRINKISALNIINNTSLRLVVKADPEKATAAGGEGEGDNDHKAPKLEGTKQFNVKCVHFNLTSIVSCVGFFPRQLADRRTEALKNSFYYINNINKFACEAVFVTIFRFFLKNSFFNSCSALPQSLNRYI